MKTKITLPLILLLAGILPAIAVNHIITFPGSSLAYTPGTLSVEVGDTITWQGPFSSHPLESTSVPAGAAVFGRGGNVTTFSYTVTVAGNYTYHCTIHGPDGMTGAFTATGTPTGISQATTADVRVFPVLTDDVVNVSLSNYSGTGMRVELINAEGNLVNTITKLENGVTPISLGTYSKGVYFVLIRNDEDIVSVTKVVKQ